ncbi:T9SS type A sorting domain-containing protein [Chryseobacterium scophthalmum]|uniref:T9SS type A sorting domain-containing protein n=1 Tax=Chryseobacterium scophthalmum TaxID=59733 RepID=UPI003D088CC0
MKEILKLILISLLFSSIHIYCQEFYVNSITGSPLTNHVHKFNINNSTEVSQNVCTPSANMDSYSDIAIDSSNNIYYISQVGLLYKESTTTSNCTYLGHFSTNPGLTYGIINSLTADSGNFLYALGGNNILFRYDINTGVFSNLGIIPNSQTAGGDLFFYENRLFLLTTTGILEINMANPSQSCPFMDINLPQLYAGFSINYGTYSKAYILSNSLNSSFQVISTLYEVDMVNKQLGNAIRIYNHNIYGAAASYNLTSTNSSCIPILSTEENNFDNDYLNVINPAKNNIIVQTNIKRSEIISIRLYDNSGRLIKDFSNQNNIVRLEISGIVSGNYLLSLSTKNGKTHTKKIIIKS